MKKAFVVILLSITTVSFSQEYYRDTTIERAVFNEVNRHRDSMGIHTVRFNSDNIRAIEWGEVLVKHDLSTDKYSCSYLVTYRGNNIRKVECTSGCDEGESDNSKFCNKYRYNDNDDIGGLGDTFLDQTYIGRRRSGSGGD